MSAPNLSLLPGGGYAQQSPGRGNAPGVPPPIPPGPSKPTYSKRGKITIVACVNCRRRKTKCDGKRPVCSQCQARDGQCHYDMSEEQRRLTYLRENVEHLAEEKSTLESLIWNLKVSTEEESVEILRRLRSGTDPQTLAEHVQAGRSLAQVKWDNTNPVSADGHAPSTAAPSSEARTDTHERLVQAISKTSALEVDEIVRRLRLHQDVNSILAAINAGTLLHPLGAADPDTEPSIIKGYSTQEQTFGLTRVGTRNVPDNEILQNRAPDAHSPPVARGISAWTTVSEDSDFSHRLLALYFSWQHSFFQSFPEKLFRHDMASGRTKYCSKLLVNAICAVGCLLSPRLEARGNGADTHLASRDFFEESLRLLKESEISSIPSVAGLFILSHVEGYRGRLNIAWDYCGRSARMALDLNLHLKEDHMSSDKLSLDAQIEDAARVHTFWGCFIADQLISFTLGRLPQIPTTAITVDLPKIVKEDDDEPWIPHGDSARARRPGARSTTFHEVALLSKIVNSTLLLFFAPSQVMKGSLLLDEYNRYLSWYRKLPPLVASTRDAPPHVLCLHMYYHAAILLLFRPFLKAKFTHSDISPSDLCRQAAAAISDIFAQHLRQYETVGIYTFQLHCLLTACTIHIINIPAIASTTYLIAACNHFYKLAEWNERATSSLDIVKELVQKWDIILPGEAEAALYRNYEEIEKNQMLDHPSVLPHERFRPSKRTAFLNPSGQVIPKRQRLAIPRLPGHASLGSSSSSQNHTESSSAAGSISVQQDSSLGGSMTPSHNREQQANYLFAPFPNQPAPLLGPIHTSTSIDTERNDEIRQVAQGFDGLSFEGGDGFFDPFMGYQGVGSYGE